MQVELETLPNCVTALRVELPPDRVAQERKNILRNYQGAAKLPGYRPGKAPANLVEARYKKEISEELQRKLVTVGTREAIAEKKLRVLSVGDVEGVQMDKDNTLRFVARVITAPEFELPPYKSLPVKVPPEEITDADIDRAFTQLRHRLADFATIEGRGLEMEDFAVMDYAGRLDGKPINELVPDAPKELTGREGFWIKLGPQTLLPGFSEALLGAQAGETRDFGVDVPEDFPMEALKGKHLEYTVKVNELKRQTLPELDDAFAEKVAPGKTLAELRDLAREELTSERKNLIESAKRQQIIAQLTGATQFELPNDFVRGETRRIMNDIVKQNQERGVSDDEIKQNESDIVSNAGQAARERLKSQFILVRIAEKEGIQASREEMDGRLNMMAARYQMTRDKLLRNLQERNALGQIEEEIVLGKTLAFLAANATVEIVAPGDPSLLSDGDDIQSDTTLS